MAKKIHPTVRALLDEIEEYRARAGIDKTNFGLAVINDGHFIRRMEAGRVPKLHTIDRVRAYIAARSKAVRRA